MEPEPSLSRLKILSDPEGTANLYCNFAYPYWKGCVFCSIYLRKLLGHPVVQIYTIQLYRDTIVVCIFMSLFLCFIQGIQYEQFNQNFVWRRSQHVSDCIEPEPKIIQYTVVYCIIFGQSFSSAPVLAKGFVTNSNNLFL